MTPEPHVLEAVEAALGERPRSARRVHGGDIAEAWRLELRGGPCFAKTHPGAPAGAFRVEAAGLRWLAEPGVVDVPEVLGVSAEVLVLAWVDAGPRTARAEEALGRGLAALHASGAPAFGAVPPGGGSAGFLSRLGVEDRTVPSWPEYFVQQRLLPLAHEAERRGALPPGGVAAVVRVGERLLDGADGLAGPPEPPARLHGDLWAGNALWGSGDRPWLIDPAAHGGHGETDLAMMRLFGGFGEETFAAYAEVTPLADGWAERVALHQLPPLLVHACLFGGHYGEAAVRAARRYA